MGIIFNSVAGLLDLIAFITGLTYKEINIIVYYVIIPFALFSLLDTICKKHYYKIAFAVIAALLFLFLKDPRRLSEWLFDKSVEFLMSFSAIGWDYITASVVVCVVVPAALFFSLRYYANRVTKMHKVGKDQ